MSGGQDMSSENMPIFGVSIILRFVHSTRISQIPTVREVSVGTTEENGTSTVS